jgi:hypothetical protein
MNIAYFEAAENPEEEEIRRIKGNFRREMVQLAAEEDGYETIPEAWREHEISELLKGVLQQDHPQRRGGEDLPDLLEGEVEIARATLANSVHGEVYSLRARPDADRCLLRMVDEYESEISLPFETTDRFLQVDEILRLFKEADPSPLNTGCSIRYQSWFYPELC